MKRLIVCAFFVAAMAVAQEKPCADGAQALIIDSTTDTIDAVVHSGGTHAVAATCKGGEWRVLERYKFGWNGWTVQPGSVCGAIHTDSGITWTNLGDGSIVWSDSGQIMKCEKDVWVVDWKNDLEFYDRSRYRGWLTGGASHCVMPPKMLDQFIYEGYGLYNKGGWAFKDDDARRAFEFDLKVQVDLKNLGVPACKPFVSYAHALEYAGMRLP